jgi:hypothetical protein
MKKRKTNKAKRVDSHCKNHGECPWCRGNRTHSSKRRAPADEKHPRNGDGFVHETGG